MSVRSKGFIVPHILARWQTPYGSALLPSEVEHRRRSSQSQGNIRGPHPLIFARTGGETGKAPGGQSEAPGHSRLMRSDVSEDECKRESLLKFDSNFGGGG